MNISSCWRLKLIYLVAVTVSWLGEIEADPLASLSDEFDSDTLSDWKRAYIEDGWPTDLLETLTIDNGVLTAVPHTSGWFEQYRGNFLFKEMQGDFIMTAKLNATSRNGDVPSSRFSLGGIMARIPNGATGTWAEDDENWSFIAMGTGTRTDSATEFEVKTTVRSNSILELRTVDPDADSGGDPEVYGAVMQMARFGNNLIILVKPDGLDWEVYRCYGPEGSIAVPPFSNLPLEQGTIQVGMHMYTDFPSWSGQGAGPVANNASAPLAAPPSDPDLVMTYEYIRFCTPNTSLPLFSQDWFDPTCSGPPGIQNPYNGNCCAADVSQLLSLLGDNGDSCVTNVVVPPPMAAPVTAAPTSSSSMQSLSTAVIGWALLQHLVLSSLV